MLRRQVSPREILAVIARPGLSGRGNPQSGGGCHFERSPQGEAEKSGRTACPHPNASNHPPSHTPQAMIIFLASWRLSCYSLLLEGDTGTTDSEIGETRCERLRDTCVIRRRIDGLRASPTTKRDTLDLSFRIGTLELKVSVL